MEKINYGHRNFMQWVVKWIEMLVSLHSSHCNACLKGFFLSSYNLITSAIRLQDVTSTHVSVTTRILYLRQTTGSLLQKAEGLTPQSLLKVDQPAAFRIYIHSFRKKQMFHFRKCHTMCGKVNWKAGLSRGQSIDLFKGVIPTIPPLCWTVCRWCAVYKLCMSNTVMVSNGKPSPCI